MKEAKQFFTLFGLTHSLSLSFSIDCVVDNRRRNQNNVDNIEQRPQAPNKTNKHSNFFTQNCVLFGLLIINSNMSISNFSNEQRMNERTRDRNNHPDKEKPYIEIDIGLFLFVSVRCRSRNLFDVEQHGAPDFL